MPENSARPDKAAEDGVDELADLRQAAAELLHKFKAYGLDRLEAARDEGGEESRDALREGRRVAEEMRKALGDLEKRLERHVREHPVSWIGGLLGAIGFGLILGMILRRRD